MPKIKKFLSTPSDHSKHNNLTPELINRPLSFFLNGEPSESSSPNKRILSSNTVEIGFHSLGNVAGLVVRIHAIHS